MRPNQHLIPVLIIIGALLISVGSYCQWTPIPGPSSAFNVRAFFSYQNKRYISTTNGLYSSSSLTGPWTYEGNIIITNFALKGDSLLYSGPEGNMDVLYLPDIHRKMNPVFTSYFHSVVAYNGHIYMANENGGFMQILPNMGNLMLNDGLPVVRIYFSHDSWFDGHPLLSMVKCGPWLIGVTYSGIYRTAISPVYWTPTCTDCTIDVRNSKLYSFGDELYVVSGNHLYKSLDFGQTLIDLGSQFPGSSVKITTLCKSDSTLYVGFGGAGIYYLQGDDPVWHDLNSGLVGKIINLIQKVDSTLVCGSATSGFNYMRPNSPWAKNNTGIFDSYTAGIIANNHYLFTKADTHIYRTGNMGNTWLNVTPAGSNNFSGPLAMNDTLLLITYPTDALNKARLLYSTSDGQTWTDITNKLPAVFSNYEFDMSYVGGKLFIRADYLRLLFYTADFGRSWVNVCYPANYCNAIYSMVYFRNSVFTAFCHYKQVARLVNDTWVDTSIGLPDNISPQDLFVCNDVLHCQLENGSWYRYDPENDMWSPETLGISKSDYYFYRQIDGDNYFGSSYSGWMITDDCLQTVRPMDFSGLLSTDAIYYLAVLNTDLFITQGANGIWTRKIERTSSVRSDWLQQNVNIYPNPAGDHFAVSGFPEGEQVCLTIYNFMGQNCAQSILKNGKNVDIGSLPEGIYLVEMLSGNQRVTGKLVVQR